MSPRHRDDVRQTGDGVVVIDTLPVVAMTDARTHRAHLVPDGFRRWSRECEELCNGMQRRGRATSVTTAEAA